MLECKYQVYLHLSTNQNPLDKYCVCPNPDLSKSWFIFFLCDRELSCCCDTNSRCRRRRTSILSVRSHAVFSLFQSVSDMESHSLLLRVNFCSLKHFHAWLAPRASRQNKCWQCTFVRTAGMNLYIYFCCNLIFLQVQRRSNKLQQNL